MSKASFIKTVVQRWKHLVVSLVLQQQSMVLGLRPVSCRALKEVFSCWFNIDYKLSISMSVVQLTRAVDQSRLEPPTFFKYPNNEVALFFKSSFYIRMRATSSGFNDQQVSKSKGSVSFIDLQQTFIMSVQDNLMYSLLVVVITEIRSSSVGLWST